MKEVSKALRNHLSKKFDDEVVKWVSVGSMTHAVSVVIQDEYIPSAIQKVEKEISEFMAECYPDVKYKFTKIGKMVLN